MSAKSSFKTAVCTDYESLLSACQRALETWSKRREEITSRGSSTKEEGDELLRLQASYAKGYWRLKKHQDTCEICRFVSEIGRSNFASISMLN
jgi:hypothetical protein